MTMIIIPVQQEAPRREITVEGIRYREVRPEDDVSWWKTALMVLLMLFLGMPLCFAFIRWFMFPLLNLMFRNAF